MAKSLVTSLLYTVTPPLPSVSAVATVLKLPLAPVPAFSTRDQAGSVVEGVGRGGVAVPNVAVTVCRAERVDQRVADRELAMPAALRLTCRLHRRRRHLRR